MSKYSDNMPPDIKGAIGWLLPYVKADTNFLDVGCSTGYFGEFIKKTQKIAVDGVEISDDIKEAKKKLDEVFSFDAEMPWPEIGKKYNYIYFGDVLEHLKNPGAALEQAAKSLKKDGLIFVSVPNIAHISIRLELLRGSFGYESMGILDNTHLQYFTKNTFITTAARVGFLAELVDFTENDMPHEMINEYLEKAGITATPKFWELTRTIESRAYQFKFVLKHSQSPVKPKSHKLDKPLQYRDDYISSFQGQLDAIHSHADKQAEIIKFYTDKAARLEKQNQDLVGQLERWETLARKIPMQKSVRKLLTRSQKSRGKT